MEYPWGLHLFTSDLNVIFLVLSCMSGSVKLRAWHVIRRLTCTADSLALLHGRWYFSKPNPCTEPKRYWEGAIREASWDPDNLNRLARPLVRAPYSWSEGHEFKTPAGLDLLRYCNWKWKWFFRSGLLHHHQRYKELQLFLALQAPSKSFRHCSLPRVMWGVLWEVKILHMEESCFFLLYM